MIKKITCTPLFVIVLVNLILKLTLFCYLTPWDKTVESTKIVVSDSKGYEQVAENLLHYRTFAPLKDTVNINNYSDYQAIGFIMYHPDSWMMPIYPVFLSTVYSVVGIKPYIAILIQILLSLISVLLVFRICILLFENNKIATIASILFALDIHSIYSSNELLTDTLFVLLLLGGIYYFLKGILSGRLSVICLGSVFMGLACLTRLLVLLYPFVLIIILFGFAKQTREWKFKAVLSYILIFTLMNGLWSFRNHNYYGHWQLTTHGGWTLLMFNTSLTKTKITHENIDSIRVSFQKQADSMGFRRSTDLFNQSEIYQKVASKYIMQHKEMYFFTNIEGGLNMFLSLGNMGMAKTFGWTKEAPDGTLAELSPQRILKNFSSNTKETVLGLVIILILALQYIGAFYGILKSVFARNFMFLTTALLTMLYFLFVTGILGNYRFKLPIVPFICILAGYGYFKMLRSERDTPLYIIDDAAKK